MKANEGSKDRAIRVYLGVALSMFFVTQNSAWALLGLIPFLTGIIGICPLYSFFGINTAKAA